MSNGSGGTAALQPIQTGAPPWPADAVGLQARLEADGLQVLTAEGQVQHTHQHLDVYVDGAHVDVPADIGIDPHRSKPIAHARTKVR